MSRLWMPVLAVALLASSGTFVAGADADGDDGNVTDTGVVPTHSSQHLRGNVTDTNDGNVTFVEDANDGSVTAWIHWGLWFNEPVGHPWIWWSSWIWVAPGICLAVLLVYHGCPNNMPCRDVVAAIAAVSGVLAYGLLGQWWTNIVIIDFVDSWTQCPSSMLMLRPLLFSVWLLNYIPGICCACYCLSSTPRAGPPEMALVFGPLMGWVAQFIALCLYRSLPCGMPHMPHTLFTYEKAASVTHFPVPTWLGISIPAIFFVVVLAGLLRTKAHIFLKIEIVASSSDFNTDLLNVFCGDWQSSELMIAQLLCAIAPGFIVVLTEHMLSILTNWGIPILTWSGKRLMSKQCHQYVDVCGDSFDSAMLNLLSTLGMILVTILSPLASLLAMIAVSSVGIFLQSCRLLALEAVFSGYVRLCHRFQPENQYESLAASRDGSVEDGSVDQPNHINARSYHTGVVAELVAEAAPSLIFNIINKKFLMQNGFKENGWMNFGTASIICSVYMIARVGWKYAHHLLYLRVGLTNIPLPQLDATTDDITQHTMGVAAAVGGAGRVAHRTVEIAVTAVAAQE